MESIRLLVRYPGWAAAKRPNGHAAHEEPRLIAHTIQVPPERRHKAS